MKFLKALTVVTIFVLTLTGCSSSPGPMTSQQAKEALAKVKKPDSLKNFKLEDPDGVDGDESDGYIQSFDASSICNSVAELSQLTYQSGFELKNKQSLPSELRGFDVREGIKFVPSQDADSEYLSLYLTLLSFNDQATAAEFASQLKEAVEPCGDVSGDYQSRITLKFSDLDGPNDFSHRTRDTFDMFDIQLISDNTDYLVQRGALIALVNVSASEDGLSYFGVSAETMDAAAKDLLKQVLP